MRDAYLNSLGLNVLRYTNHDINRKFKEVCEDVYRHLLPFSTSSPPAGGAFPQGEAKEDAEQSLPLEGKVAPSLRGDG